MDSTHLKEGKSTLRKSMKAVRSDAFQAIHEPEIKVWKSLKPLFEALPSHTVVGGYAPIQTEFPTWQLMKWVEEMGHQLALPLVTGEGEPLTFLSWSSASPLIDGAFGAKTPDPATAEKVAPDVMLIPLLAFDEKGFRLGYGGGFYDRSIALYKSNLTIGIAFSAQKVVAVPVGTYDLALTHIVTEAGLLVVSAL